MAAELTRRGNKSENREKEKERRKNKRVSYAYGKRVDVL